MKLVLLSLAALPLSYAAAEVYSPVVGFLRFDCPAESDTIVSVPFHPAPRWAGRLAATPADQGAGVVRLSLKDDPGFAAGELVDTPHFLYCRDAAGPEGRHFPVVAHGASTVDVSATPAEFGALGEDGLVSLIPAWTLDTLLPPDSQTALHPSSGALASQRVSELLFFDAITTGSNLAPSRRFYVTDSAWFEVGDFAEAGGTVIAPGQAFVIRHPAGVAATEFVPNQQVYGGKVSLDVRVANGKAQDTMVAPPRPVILTLGELDLGPSTFEESASNDSGDRKDELLVFDNADPGLNKQPTAKFFRSGGQWLADGSNDPSDNREIEPTAGLLLRKAAAGAAQTLRWLNDATYDVTAP